ncbi:MAG TPA: extracellular solute-binding protein [Streptosporangiaceae bacterium]|nr:extracellular solute-binding protein [Streptosporangiaceae bacterium]
MVLALTVCVASACASGGNSASGTAGAPTTGTSGNGPPTEARACGTTPVTMQAYVETGFADAPALMHLFTKQYPKVTWNIRQNQFAVITQSAPLVLSGSNAPDLMRMPQLSGLVHDHLLKNLDPYFKEYGWRKFPASQLAQMRMPPAGHPRGTGSLWAMGLNYSLTGVFYNKALAARIGMTSPPATLAQFDALLANAKKAGITPIVQFDGGATGGLLFPLQQLMADYGPTDPINNWIFQKPGATISTQSNLAAATHLDQWIKKGYFNSDANATVYAQMMSKFEHGQGLFMFDGDWESGNLDSLMPHKLGFFVMPPLKAGGEQAAMSAPLTYGISARAQHPDCAAFFLNWVATNPAARKLDVQSGGSNPGGPPGLPIPEQRGTLVAQTLAAGKVIARESTGMDFIANATGAIYAEAWTPAVQKLFADQETPQAVLQTVQAAYGQQIKSGA